MTMKKNILLGLFSFFAAISLAQTNDPVLMTIAGKNITKSEFEYIWKKNNSNSSAEKVSKEAYLDMFVNFKLKVADAEAKHLDKYPDFLNEFQGYRKQLIEPYLSDSLSRKELISQCYDRLKQYIEVSLISINCKPDATPEDTLEYYHTAMNIYDRIVNGADFAEMAKKYSNDASAQKGGYLGFLTGLRFIFPLENMAFNMPVGAISKPFRTEFGYHIIKVHNRFPAKGRFSMAHILKVVPQGVSDQIKAAAKDSIFRIYKELKKGGDFTFYATKCSDDANAASNGGKYDLSDCGYFPYTLEQEVYKLKVGEYSAPFQTEYGWHIVKALDFKPYLPLDDVRTRFEGLVGSNKYMKEYLYDQFTDSLIREFGFKLVDKEYVKVVEYCNKARLRLDSVPYMVLGISNDPLFYLGAKAYPVNLFVTFLKAVSDRNKDIKGALFSFVREQAYALEDQNLEKKYPAFGALMQEYRDGILLFNISNMEVWEKAAQDKPGLEKYFAANRKKYNWDKPRYKGALVSCANEDVAAKAKKLIKGLPLDSIGVVLNRTFNRDTLMLVHTEFGLFAQGANPQVDFLVFNGSKAKTDLKFPVTFVQGKVLKKAPETHIDVLGQVVTDYQNLLEQNWIKDLREKYPVVINKDVLNTVNND